MKCPVCGREIESHIEIWNFQWVEIWTLACSECLCVKKKKNNKRVA